MNEVSTHNVEALSERNDTTYDPLMHEGEEGNPPEHQNIFTRLLSKSADIVHERMSFIIQSIEKSETFQKVAARAIPIYENTIKPSLDVAHTNVTIASENLVDPVAAVSGRLENWSALLSAQTQKVQDSASAKWRKLFSDDGPEMPSNLRV